LRKKRRDLLVKPICNPSLTPVYKRNWRRKPAKRRRN